MLGKNSARIATYRIAQLSLAHASRCRAARRKRAVRLEQLDRRDRVWNKAAVTLSAHGVVVLASIVILPLPPMVILGVDTQDILRCCFHLYNVESKEYLLYYSVHCVYRYMM